MLYLSEIKWDGKSFAELAIKRGMPMDVLMCTMINATINLNRAFEFDCIDYKALGLDRCDIEPMSIDKRLCAILNAIVGKQNDFTKALANISKVSSGGSTTGITGTTPSTPGATVPTTPTDSLVKISKDDKVPGYLQDKIISSQSDTLAIVKDATNGDKIVLTGFVPLGAVLMIDGSRATAFDNTGKGKPNTDCICFAISNGNNGTTNRLGRFPRWAQAIADVGKTGGAADFTVKLANMEAFDLPVDITTSTFDGSSTNLPNFGNVTVPMNWGNAGMTQTHDVLENRPGTTQSNFTHNHTVKGNVSNAPNPNAIEKILMLPLYIDELPIQRII